MLIFFCVFDIYVCVWPYRITDWKYWPKRAIYYFIIICFGASQNFWQVVSLLPCYHIILSFSSSSLQILTFFSHSLLNNNTWQKNRGSKEWEKKKKKKCIISRRVRLRANGRKRIYILPAFNDVSFLPWFPPFCLLSSQRNHNTLARISY
jgi:hypothetical protein